jgi:hypothetical protein
MPYSRRLLEQSPEPPTRTRQSTRSLPGTQINHSVPDSSQHQMAAKASISTGTRARNYRPADPGRAGSRGAEQGPLLEHLPRHGAEPELGRENHHQGLAWSHKLSDGSVYFFLTHSDVDDGGQGSLSAYRFGGPTQGAKVPRSRPLSRDRTRCPRCPASRCTTRCRHRRAVVARVPRRARPVGRIRPQARPGALRPRARCRPARQDAAGS